MGEVFTNVTDLVACSQINPIYIKVVHTALCNETVNSMITLWGSMLCGALATLVFIMIYTKFDFNAVIPGSFRQFTTAGALSGGAKGDAPAKQTV